MKLSDDVDVLAPFRPWFLRLLERYEGLRIFLMSVKKSVRIILNIGVICLVGGVALVGLLQIYQSLDEAGWISHQHDTPVWIAGDWMVGEYRACEMRTTESVSPESRAEFPVLYCGKTETGFAELTGFAEFNDSLESNRYFHALPVTYYGRINRPDSAFISWRCQRNTGQLTCKALN